jgi:hypothetical protein
MVFIKLAILLSLVKNEQVTQHRFPLKVKQYYLLFVPGEINSLHPAQVPFEGEVVEAKKSAWPHQGTTGRSPTGHRRCSPLSRFALRMRPGQFLFSFYPVYNLFIKWLFLGINFLKWDKLGQNMLFVGWFVSSQSYPNSGCQKYR